RLKQRDGQAILIPVDATGAERLFDAFASLPGMKTSDLVAALQPADATGQTLPQAANLPEMRLIWRRAGKGVVAQG
ncbi:MAG: hypothetical protein ACD_54C01179G0003, partial [uncultured bacterium]